MSSAAVLLLMSDDVERLFEVIRGLKARGVGIVYISHKMDEIFDITDRITVLRDGRVQGTRDTVDTDVNRITRMMIGRIFGDAPRILFRKG
mgnify:CR=1 FL=1